MDPRSSTAFESFEAFAPTLARLPRRTILAPATCVCGQILSDRRATALFIALPKLDVQQATFERFCCGLGR